MRRANRDATSMPNRSGSHPAPTRVRSLRRAAAALIALVVVSACAGLPTSDRIEEGQPVVGQPQQNVQALPAAPEVGADAPRIVDGFLRANVGVGDDHDTAQLYLTPQLGDLWRPTSRVVIYDGGLQVESVATGRIRVTVDLAATLDDQGRLVEEPDGQEWVGDFDLEQIDGQWRISAFPEEFGLLLSRAEFSGQYTQRPITYLSPVRDEYVMDRRWFPNYSQGELPTALARAQVQAVPDYLDGAVDHGFPSRTELAGAGVPVDPGTFLATVELTGAGTSATDEQLQWMWVQMAKTMTSGPGVSQVSLRSSGYPMTVPGIEESLGDPADLGFDDAELRTRYALLRVRDALQPVQPDAFDLRAYSFPEDSARPDLPEIGLPWIDLATDAGVTEFAAVSWDRSDVARWSDALASDAEADEDAEFVMAGIGTGLTAPSFDRVDGLWVAGRATHGPLVWWIDRSVEPSQAVARSVSAEWLEPEWEIGAFRVAPDDTRAVIHVRDPLTGVERLGITAIVRDDDQRPVSLTEPMWVADTMTSVRSVTWEDPDNLLLLGQREQDSSDVPYHYPIGGWLEPMGSVDLARGARSGTDSTGEAFRIVLNQQGNIFTPEGQGWASYRNGDDVAIPGY